MDATGPKGEPLTIQPVNLDDDKVPLEFELAIGVLNGAFVFTADLLRAIPADVEVGLAIEHLGTSSMRYRIGIFAEGENDAAAEGHFVHVMVDRTSRRSVPIPEQWRAALEAIRAD